MNLPKPRSFKILLQLLCSLGLTATPMALWAQTEAPTAVDLAPGPKPADVSGEWRRLVGIYGPPEERSIVLERNQALFWHNDRNEEEPIYPADKGQGTFLINNSIEFIAQSDAVGNVTELVMGSRETPLPRADAGTDPVHFYRVKPSRPIEELRAAALLESPPQEEGPFRKPELVELTSLDAAIHLDIRYAKSNNFLSTPVYLEARAFLQRPAAEALVRVLHKLQPMGYGLLIHDAYRPWFVTKIFWEATPSEGRIFVADPKKGSKHNRGCAVDLTLYDLATRKAIEMTGLYDEMSPRSFPTFPGGTSLQRWHRDLLRRAMESEGLAVNEEEWWHFDYKDWKQYPILNLSFEKLGGGS